MNVFNSKDMMDHTSASCFQFGQILLYFIYFSLETTPECLFINPNVVLIWKLTEECEVEPAQERSIITDPSEAHERDHQVCVMSPEHLLITSHSFSQGLNLSQSDDDDDDDVCACVIRSRQKLLLEIRRPQIHRWRKWMQWQMWWMTAVQHNRSSSSSSRVEMLSA